MQHGVAPPATHSGTSVLVQSAANTTLWGVLFGVLFVGVLDNGLILLNVGPYYANLAVGAVLIVAAAADAFYQRLERVPVRVDDMREDVQEAPA